DRLRIVACDSPAVARAVSIRVRPIDSAEQIPVPVRPERAVAAVASVGIIIVVVADPEYVVEQIEESIGPEDRSEPDHEDPAPEEIMIVIDETAVGQLGGREFVRSGGKLAAFGRGKLAAFGKLAALAVLVRRPTVIRRRVHAGAAEMDRARMPAH